MEKLEKSTMNHKIIIIFWLLLLWIRPAGAQQKQLPCLNLSQGCQRLLLELAMENSNEFLVLREQEEIGKRLLENQSDKAWTAWITADPISLVQNVFGGGRKQDIELALAQLKVELTKLKIKQESLANSYGENILLLLSEYSRLDSEKTRLESRVRIKRTQMIIARIEYLQGGSSHSEMSRFREKVEDFSEKIESLSEQSKGVLLELQKLVGVVGNGLEKNLVDSAN